MTKYNTNLASEFFVLSQLYRLGIEANLTLGNKKSVDILATNRKGELITIDVKGGAKKYEWPVGNVREPKHGKHFVVLVSYEGNIEDPTFMPLTWIVPYEELKPFIVKYPSGRVNVSRAKINAEGQRYLNAWEQLGDIL